MINLICIAFIICYVIDISGIIDDLKRLLFRYAVGDYMPYKDFQLKPFTCSRCMIWWVGCIYLLFTGLSWPMLAFVALLSCLNEQITDTISTIQDSYTILLRIINYKLEKWESKRNQ